MLKFYIWLLCKASYKKREVFIGKKRISLEPGAVVCGLNSAQKELGISREILRRIIKTLEQTQRITYMPTHSYSVITLLDKGVFAPLTSKENTPCNTLTTPLSNNNKEYKKENNKRILYKEKEPQSSERSYDLELYKKMFFGESGEK